MAIADVKSNLGPQSAGRSPKAVPLPPPIVALLTGVRKRIRRYVLAEGLAALAVVLLTAFWFTLIADWFFEPPAWIRVAALVAVASLAGWVGYRLIVDRLRVQLADRSLALLLERKYPQFGDSLLTAVEYASPDSRATDAERMLVAAAVDEAIKEIPQIDLDALFNPAPLVRNVLLGAALAVGVIAFALFQPRSVETWARRVLALSNELWPRTTRLVIEGFENGSIKVARGSDVELVVNADTSMRVPAAVRVNYRTDEGLRGRATMTQRGKAEPGRDPYQQFSHHFQGVLTPITFDVYGGDDRRRDLRIEVVDSPAVTGMSLDCEYPEYMRRDAREIAVTGAMRIPRGTRITLRFETNKEMVEVRLADGAAAADGEPTQSATEVQPLDPQDRRRFAYDLGTLDGDRSLAISLLDADDIRNREPNRLLITAAADEPPQIDIRLRGIGAAITPQALIPVVGEMQDDYGIAKTWFEFALDGQPPLVQELTRSPRETTELPVDDAFDVRARGLQPGQKVTLSVKAQDTFALGDAPQIGSSSQYHLDVVTPDQLRALLEGRELNLRRRFEQLIGEVVESRDALARLAPREAEAVTPADQDATEASGDEEASEASAEEPQSRAERELVRDRLRVEQVLQNSRKNADETLGVAVAFEDIHDELVNNRVDTQELKSRLKQGIAEPLRSLAGPAFSELETRLTELQKSLDDPSTRAVSLTAAEKQVDEVLFGMQQVLNKMIELETFNEVVDLLRTIIDSQEGVNAKTQDLRKAKLRDLLE